MQRLAQATLKHTGPAGRETIEQDTAKLTADWDEYTTRLTDVTTQLKDALDKWERYEQTYQTLQYWVKAMEVKVKDVPLVATLDEKRTELTKYKVGHVNYANDSWCGSRLKCCMFLALILYYLILLSCGFFLYLSCYLFSVICV